MADNDNITMVMVKMAMVMVVVMMTMSNNAVFTVLSTATINILVILHHPTGCWLAMLPTHNRSTPPEQRGDPMLALKDNDVPTVALPGGGKGTAADRVIYRHKNMKMRGTIQ